MQILVVILERHKNNLSMTLCNTVITPITNTLCIHLFIDGLVQERPNSSVLAMELCLSCTNPSICLSDIMFKKKFKSNMYKSHQQSKQEWNDNNNYMGHNS